MAKPGAEVQIYGVFPPSRRLGGSLAHLGETEGLKEVGGSCLEVMVDIALGYCISKVLRVALFHVYFFLHIF